jgi:hypothetical protein
MSTTQCSSCKESVPSYDTIYVDHGTTTSDYRPLCSRCYNRRVAGADAISFTHVRFDPVEMADADGGMHQFHFRTHLGPNACLLDAVEVKDGKARGHEFSVAGDREASPFALMAQLLARMRQGLAVRQLEDDPHAGTQIAGRRVSGRITWDKESDGRVPLVVIDGREFSWDELGRMLMTFEGWRFKLEIHDRAEDI